MIIKALADLVYTLLDVLLVFELPSLPDSIVTVANTAVDACCTGIEIIRAFTGSSALALIAVLLNLLLFAHSAYMVITFVDWILRKIPLLDVEM